MQFETGLAGALFSDFSISAIILFYIFPTCLILYMYSKWIVKTDVRKEFRSLKKVKEW